MVAEAVETVAQVTAQEIPFESWSAIYQGAEEEAPAQVSEKVLGGCEVPASLFEDLLAVGKVASGDPTRPILTGVLMQANGDGLTLVATDTYRLFVRNVKLYREVTWEGGPILPVAWLRRELPKIIKEQGGKRSWSYLQRIPLTWAEVTTIKTHKRRTYNKDWRNTILSTEQHEDLVRVAETRQVLYIGKDRNHTVELIDGQFVNWRVVVPDAAKADGVLGVRAYDLLNGADWCGVVASSDDNRVFLQVDGEGLTMEAKAKDGKATASAEYPVGGELEGEAFGACVNWSYLADFLKACGPAVHVEVRHWADRPSVVNKDEKMPCAVTLTSGDDLYVLMQMMTD